MLNPVDLALVVLHTYRAWRMVSSKRKIQEQQSKERIKLFVCCDALPNVLEAFLANHTRQLVSAWFDKNTTTCTGICVMVKPEQSHSSPTTSAYKADPWVLQTLRRMYSPITCSKQMGSQPNNADKCCFLQTYPRNKNNKD